MIEASNSENVQDFTGMSGPGLAKALQMKKAIFVCESKAQILRALKHGLARDLRMTSFRPKNMGSLALFTKWNIFLDDPLLN